MESDEPDRTLSAGPQYDASHWHDAPVPDPGRGVHLWVVIACWQVSPFGDEEMFLDEENLLSLRGPKCFKCARPADEAPVACRF